MDKQILKAEARKITGRKVKTLREKGFLPANVYGKKIKSESLQVSLKEFSDLFTKVGETGLVSLVIGASKGKKDDRPVLVANVQKDPVTDNFLHVDFRQVDLKEKVEAEVTVELIGESPAEKQGIGTVVQYFDEIKVEALPTDLPEKFEVDASALTEVDQQVLVKDLKFDKAKVELKIDPETIIVKVEPPQKEEVVAPPPAAGVPTEGEVPAEGEAPVAEGEAAPAEGPTPAQEPKAEEQKKN